jgi:hypothetical protein
MPQEAIMKICPDQTQHPMNQQAGIHPISLTPLDAGIPMQSRDSLIQEILDTLQLHTRLLYLIAQKLEEFETDAPTM